MEATVFEQFCALSKGLSVGQMRQLRDLLLAMDARIDLLSRIDERRTMTRRHISGNEAISSAAPSAMASRGMPNTIQLASSCASV